MKSSFKQSLVFLLLILCGITCTLSATAADIKPPKVVFISPPLERHFWINLTQLMRAAADDLGIELKARVSRHESDSFFQECVAFLNAEQPDYLVTGFWPGASEKVLDFAEQHGIKTFIINTKIDEKLGIGKPREKYRHWIGHLYPEDANAGYQLIDILIAQYALHAAAKPDGRINIIAVSGPSSSPASNFRLAGMENRISGLPNAHLLHAAHCHWGRACAASATLTLLKKYPQSEIIWAASDLLALGAADAVTEIGKTPGKDVYIGGIDWSPPGLQGVADGRLSVSLGGHFFEGAWALVMIYDYHHGIDFKEYPGVRHATRMDAITANNVKRYLAFLSDPNWQLIDFKHYSKSYNHALKHYNFSIDTILKELTGSDK